MQSNPAADPLLDAVPQRPVIAVLALGSNLGDSRATLASGVQALAGTDGIDVVAQSPLVRTAPVGGPPDQPDYLNQVIEVHTVLSARALLHAAHAVEQAHHRERIVRWGPRTLDIDIITYGTLSSRDEELTLPHPRAAERAFVLVPWSWMDPGAFLSGRSVFELADAAPDRAGVRPDVQPGPDAEGEAGAEARPDAGPDTGTDALPDDGADEEQA